MAATNQPPQRIRKNLHLPLALCVKAAELGRTVYGYTFSRTVIAALHDFVARARADAQGLDLDPRARRAPTLPPSPDLESDLPPSLAPKPAAPPPPAGPSYTDPHGTVIPWDIVERAAHLKHEFMRRYPGEPLNPGMLAPLALSPEEEESAFDMCKTDFYEDYRDQYLSPRIRAQRQAEREGDREAREETELARRQERGRQILLAEGRRLERERQERERAAKKLKVKKTRRSR